MDPTKSHKYLQLFCKLFSKRYREGVINEKGNKEELLANMNSIGICNPENLSTHEMYFIRDILWQFYHTSQFNIITQFIGYMEKGVVTENDVTKYSTFDDISAAVSLVSIKQVEKEMERQVHKVYEDENWLVVLPLTFESSSKYGAGTKWCTTYQKEKHYFARYWNRGILAYFINKKTGNKFAGFRGLDDGEMSFWNVQDNRMDYLDIEIEDYMFSVVKNIFKSKKVNSEYLDIEMRCKVCEECSVIYDEPLVRLSETVGRLYLTQPVAEFTINEQISVHLQEESEFPQINGG